MAGTLRRIVIEAVAQSDMRAPYDKHEIGGDWLVNDDGELIVRAIGADLDDPETFLFCLHELVEAVLCRREGVPQEAVDAFDVRIDDQLSGDDEPGDHPEAPYRTQHRRAMLVEHLMASFMGLTDYGRIS